MRLKAFKSVGDPQPIVQDVGVLVVEGEHGQPIMVACDLGGGVIMAEVLKPNTEVEFNRILQSLGIDKLVMAEDLSRAMTPMDQEHKMPLITGRE